MTVWGLGPLAVFISLGWTLSASLKELVFRLVMRRNRG